MRCRKFFLQNEAGDRFPLDGSRYGVWAKNPNGLGLAAAGKFSSLGDGFFARTDSSDPQQSFSAVLVFTRSAYSTYRSFLAWLSRAQELLLGYQSTDVEPEYFRRVEVNSLAKTELSACGWLEIPASFWTLTPWFLPQPASMQISGSESGSILRYDYSYTEDLAYGDDSPGLISATVQPSGDVPGGMRIDYTGAVDNPEIRLVGDLTGRVYGSCRAETSLLDSDRLEYRSAPDSSYLHKVSASGDVTDLLPRITDLLSCWLRVPTGEPCSLTLGGSSAVTGTAQLTVYYYHRSV